MKNVVFIDGVYLSKIAAKLNCNINYQKLAEAFANYFDGPTRIYYYICTSSQHRNETNPIKPRVDWLSYNGYITRYRLIPEAFFNQENRAYIASQFSVDAFAVADPNNLMIFCVSNPELVIPISKIAETCYTVMLSSDALSAHQDLRQATDRTFTFEYLIENHQGFRDAFLNIRN